MTVKVYAHRASAANTKSMVASTQAAPLKFAACRSVWVSPYGGRLGVKVGGDVEECGVEGQGFVQRHAQVHGGIRTALWTEWLTDTCKNITFP